MKISVIINNFNYGRFIARAVHSVLGQAPPPHEVIVVDDGSTDDSHLVLSTIAQTEPSVRIIAKPNGGQLSALNAGFCLATGDIICFLDADDEYLPGYLDKLSETYRANAHVDFVYCGLEFVRDGKPIQEHFQYPAYSDHGISLFRTLLLGDWIGAPTSALSARRRLLEKFLPCDLEAQWRIRADDVVVIGSSMCFGRKLGLPSVHVRYHVHGTNSWFGGEMDPGRRLREKLERMGLAGHFGRDVITSLTARRDWRRLVLREFQTIPNPNFSDARLYARLVVRASGSYGLFWKMKIYASWLKTLLIPKS